MALSAQNAQGGPAGPSRRRAPEPVVVSLSFEGGSLKEFVAAVRKEQPKANIVLSQRAYDALIPPMVMRDAGVEQALEGACMAADANFQVRVKEFRGAGQPVYSIYAISQPQMGGVQAVGPKPGEMARRVLSISDLISPRASGMPAMKVETVLSALELTTSGEKEPPRIRYHEDSGLVLLRGSLDQIHVVEEAILTMGVDLDKRELRYREIQRRKEIEKSNGKAK